jgi:ABC-2 type transport system ATP-binding protein
VVSIDIRDAAVDFPVFDAKTRSLKKAVLGRAGGRIGTESKVPIIEALRNITLSLRQGERVALVGHNGAGKSTLLRLMSGIYEPTRGRAQVIGRSRPCSTSPSAWTRRSPGWTTSSSAGCSSA